MPRLWGLRQAIEACEHAAQHLTAHVAFVLQHQAYRRNMQAECFCLRLLGGIRHKDDQPTA